MTLPILAFPLPFYMRKEIIFAIIAGIILGVIIAFGAWRINSVVETEKITTETKKTPPENNDVPEEDLAITLSNTDNYDVITSQPLTITGLTKPNSKLIISAEENDYIVNADEAGEFSAKVDLVGGINRLILLAVDKNNNSAAKELVLIYSSEFAKQISPD